MAEDFDLGKMLSGPFTGVYWAKVIMFGTGMAILLVVGVSVHRFFFKKPEPTQTIHAETGSNVQIIQRNDRKKSLIPFVEGYVDQPNDRKFGSGIRAGVRFEW